MRQNFDGIGSCWIDKVVELWQFGGPKDSVDGKLTGRYSYA